MGYSTFQSFEKWLQFWYWFWNHACPNSSYPSCSMSSIFVLLNRACPSNTHTYRLSTWMPMNGNSYYNSQFNKFLNKWHYGDELNVSDEILNREKTTGQTISERNGIPGLYFRNEDGLFIVASQGCVHASVSPHSMVTSSLAYLTSFSFSDSWALCHEDGS